MGPHSFECGNAAMRVYHYRTGKASMGPHSFECGNSLATRCTRCGWRGFNGAALVRVRKSGIRVDVSPGCHASMGPHSFECGNAGVDDGSILAIYKLQWGRTRSSAEIPQRPQPADLRAIASMGPHSFECGNSRTSSIVSRNGP